MAGSKPYWILSASLLAALLAGLACSGGQGGDTVPTDKGNAASPVGPEGTPTVAGADQPISAADLAIDPLYVPWARVLEAYVDDQGLVDYGALQGRGGADLEEFMRAIADFDVNSLGSEAEQIAFWINAYNATVVWQVIERYPLESVRDVGVLYGLVGGFFKQKNRIAGEERSLDDIEHGTLRRNFPDARIHWTLVCAAFGCPRLLSRPYLAADLDPVLTEQGYEFLGQPRALQIDRDQNILYLSHYFDWYEGDFEAETGTVIDYVLRYAPDQAAAYIRQNRDSLKVRFIDYDWTLNDQVRGPRRPPTVDP